MMPAMGRVPASLVSLVFGALALAPLPPLLRRAANAAPPEEIRTRLLDGRGILYRDESPWELTEYAAPVGDVDGDGLADFILLRRDISRDHEGELLLVRGSRDIVTVPVPSMADVRARATVFVRSTPRTRAYDILEQTDPADDLDGRITITDAIIILGSLLPGTGPLPSLVDADGSGAVDITDAVVILRHLFQGGEALCR